MAGPKRHFHKCWSLPCLLPLPLKPKAESGCISQTVEATKHETGPLFVILQWNKSHLHDGRLMDVWGSSFTMLLLHIHGPRYSWQSLLTNWSSECVYVSYLLLESWEESNCAKMQSFLEFWGFIKDWNQEYTCLGNSILTDLAHQFIGPCVSKMSKFEFNKFDLFYLYNSC